ncbi:putative C-type lectin domain family 20 member A isoform X2 [Hemibagrus wyckioides]|uniref:putative C-type lectin domain family 20 member A isoform X2 n=1 Tax=Hemibagrus wyckioides TaxID=337641 RepID=UPI00266B6484|nr:putative C-type lectin domain family 20 member A isoform X2 [Hemibagrus wyckioides]
MVPSSILNRTSSGATSLAWKKSRGATLRKCGRKYYDDIATVANADDWIRLRKEETDKGLTSRAWIGLYNDIESWRWSFNNVSLKNQLLAMWYAGEPDNAYGKEACATINQLGEWRDDPCTDLLPFICYNSSATGSNIIVGVASPLLSWFDAQAYCRKYHTDLASATTTSENNQLAQVALKQGYSWFGLFRDTWKWVDRTFEDATNLEWLNDPAQPNNGGGHEDCGVIYTGLIMDRPCDDLYPFFCHNDIPTGKRQIVKLQVNSGENIFDPAVQSTILKKIEQKLEEHGWLENTTVTWKLQPNGNDFDRKKKGDI